MGDSGDYTVPTFISNHSHYQTFNKVTPLAYGADTAPAQRESASSFLMEQNHHEHLSKQPRSQRDAETNKTASENVTPRTLVSCYQTAFAIWFLTRVEDSICCF